ncbi:Carboxypeptidase N subunit 2 [Holothuria leucospilota]|uniref:Carboxypeptidase N subunit 2 n=1 Tax=Holothuria leucospilota TaxID=206669 RepID=A0A9Q1BMZ8_HOLLE|nr:Carboxypeptidase N subunit 2 [Holothuria leucospilota]
MAVRWISLLLLCLFRLESSYQDQCVLYWTTLTCDGSKLNLTTFPSLDLCEEYRTLSIINTNLTDLQSGKIVLPQCSRLVSLDLSFNGIRILNTSIVRSNPAIEMLKLVGNKLRSVPKDILAGTLFLEYIDLSRNLIETIEEFSFHQNKYLQYLNVKDNRIYTIYGNAFSGLESLHYLHLSNNFITEFPFRDSGYNFSHLREMSLRNNNISRLSTSTDRYVCESIDLAQNLLQSVDDFALVGFPDTSLRLAHNFISRLETFIFGKSPHNLTALGLPFNLLTEIPTSLLRQLPKLVNLNLGNNRLTRIPKEAFTSNRYLMTITLRNNYIHEVHPMALVGLHRLTALNLRNNKLTTLPAELFDPSVQFLIQLFGNNWTCDCEVYPILEWLQKSQYFVDDIKCGTTLHENTSFLLEFPFEEICSGIEEEHVVTTLTTGLLTTDVIDTEAQFDETDIPNGRQEGVQLTPFMLPLLLLFISSM